MELLRILTLTHVLAGVISLVTGPVAMSTTKGGKSHINYGKVYFYAMTYVFVSAIFLSSIKFIPFLFMLSFISYYTCFSGVRILKLKRLHQGQKPKWYDWAAGAVTILAGIGFIGYAIYILNQGNNTSLAGLSIFFGVFTVQSGANGLWQFLKKHSGIWYWWSYHIGGMMGSYIAASTAFAVTIGRMTSYHHWVLWVAPALIGTPMIIYWQKSYKKKMNLI